MRSARVWQRLGLLVEEGQQEELFLACGKADRVFADRIEIGGGLLTGDSLRDERDRSLHGRIDRARRRPEASVEKRA